LYQGTISGVPQMQQRNVWLAKKLWAYKTVKKEKSAGLKGDGMERKALFAQNVGVWV
jgi:hypothetical protein